MGEVKPPRPKIIYKLGKGEICVANFIPPANSANLGSYFCVKNLTSALKQFFVGPPKEDIFPGHLTSPLFQSSYTITM